MENVTEFDRNIKQNIKMTFYILISLYCFPKYIFLKKLSLTIIFTYFKKYL